MVSVRKEKQIKEQLKDFDKENLYLYETRYGSLQLSAAAKFIKEEMNGEYILHVIAKSQSDPLVGRHKAQNWFFYTHKDGVTLDIFATDACKNLLDSQRLYSSTFALRSLRLGMLDRTIMVL